MKYPLAAVIFVVLVPFSAGDVPLEMKGVHGARIKNEKDALSDSQGNHRSVRRRATTKASPDLVLQSQVNLNCLLATGVGQAVSLVECNKNNAAQVWWFDTSDYIHTNGNSDWCMTASSSSSVIVSSCGNSNAWTLTEYSGFESKAYPGKCLTSSGSTSTKLLTCQDNEHFMWGNYIDYPITRRPAPTPAPTPPVSPPISSPGSPSPVQVAIPNTIHIPVPAPHSVPLAPSGFPTIVFQSKANFKCITATNRNEKVALRDCDPYMEKQSWWMETNGYIHSSFNSDWCLDAKEGFADVIVNDCYFPNAYRMWKYTKDNRLENSAYDGLCVTTDGSDVEVTLILCEPTNTFFWSDFRTLPLSAAPTPAPVPGQPRPTPKPTGPMADFGSVPDQVGPNQVFQSVAKKMCLVGFSASGGSGSTIRLTTCRENDGSQEWWFDEWNYLHNAKYPEQCLFWTNPVATSECDIYRVSPNPYFQWTYTSSGQLQSLYQTDNCIVSIVDSGSTDVYRSMCDTSDFHRWSLYPSGLVGSNGTGGSIDSSGGDVSGSGSSGRSEGLDPKCYSSLYAMLASVDDSYKTSGMTSLSQSSPTSSIFDDFSTNEANNAFYKSACDANDGNYVELTYEATCVNTQTGETTYLFVTRQPRCYPKSDCDSASDDALFRASTLALTEARAKEEMGGEWQCDGSLQKRVPGQCEYNSLYLSNESPIKDSIPTETTKKFLWILPIRTRKMVDFSIVEGHNSACQEAGGKVITLAESTLVCKRKKERYIYEVSNFSPCISNACGEDANTTQFQIFASKMGQAGYLDQGDVCSSAVAAIRYAAISVFGLSLLWNIL